MRLASTCVLLTGLACRPATSEQTKDSDAPSGTSTPDCSLIGCQDGLQGTFSPAFTDAGAYVFTLEIDGTTSSCAGSLPLRSDFSCTGVLQLQVSGSALPDEEHQLPGFDVFQSDFDALTLSVVRDDTEVAAWSLVPEWDTIQPNGPGCEPTCTVGQANLVWP